MIEKDLNRLCSKLVGGVTPEVSALSRKLLEEERDLKHAESRLDASRKLWGQILWIARKHRWDAETTALVLALLSGVLSGIQLQRKGDAAWEFVIELCNKLSHQK